MSGPVTVLPAEVNERKINIWESAAGTPMLIPVYPPHKRLPHRISCNQFLIHTSTARKLPNHADATKNKLENTPALTKRMGRSEYDDVIMK